MIGSLRVALNCLGEADHSLLVVSDAFERISLSEVSQTILRLKLDNRSEISEGLLPFLLEDVDLSSGDVSFKIPWVSNQCFGEGLQGIGVVVDSSVGDGQHDKHGLAVVGAQLEQVSQIGNSLPWLRAVQAGDGPVEKSIVVLFV